jgi:DNA polymerase-1
LTREATKAFNIACEEMEGFEADDMIATLAFRARDAGGRVTIISSDKDLMQLVGDGIDMYDAMKNKRIDKEGVFEKFGVYPDRVIDVQALAGDSVDNVPGAPGIGVKTAATLINDFGDLDELLRRSDEIKQPKRRQTLIENAEQIKLSRELVTLDCNTPLEFGLEDLEFNAPVPDELLDFLDKMEFRTLTKRIAQKFGVEIPTPDNLDLNNKTSHSEQIPFDSKNYEHIKTVDRLKTWINKIYETGYVAIDTETTSLNDMLAELVGISLSVEIGLACYIPIGHKEGQNDDLFESSQLAEGQLDLEFVLEGLRPILEDDSILKIGQNIKYDAKVLSRYGVMVTTFDDTMLLSYALHGGLHNHGMDALSQRYLEHSPIAIKTLIGSGKSAITFDKVKIDDAVAYAAEDADITFRLWKIFKQKLHLSRVTKVYETLERPLVSVLAQVEKNGIKVDRETLSRMSNAFAQKMASLEAEIYEMAGDTFNVGSPKQLGEIMFDKLGYEGGKKGKNGAYATGADILEDLATNHDFPKRVLDWRQLSKLKSTYTDALQDHINPNTGRVHTSYSIAGAVTGRLSSTEPNLQNIPVRTEDGRRIREAFVAESGNILVSLDYSQIELRILAHIAQIDALQQAFHEGLDIHAMTASEMFNVPLDEMTSEIRRQAKAINFGVIYGISGFGLARNLRIPRSEAQGFIDRYFERFPGIKEYMDKTVKFSKENNYVETLFGRVIHTPEINAKGPMAGFAKRAAINAPIQGTAADIIRRAMIRVPDAIKGMPAKMLLQVHDELLFEVKEEDYEELIAKVRSIMETASLPFLKMDIPLSVDAGRGLNWAEAH